MKIINWFREKKILKHLISTCTKDLRKKLSSLIEDAYVKKEA